MADLPQQSLLADFHGQPALALRAPDGASAAVLLHGAQVVSWRPAGGDEGLFLSERSRFGEGQAVRGGIPVVFPQFSERGPLPRHGFVRTRRWQLVRAEAGADDALAILQLVDDESTRAIWPASFVLELTIRVSGNRLDVELAVANCGATSFEFMAALHTYLRVAEVEAVRLAGLRGCRYDDAVTGTAQTEVGEALRFDAEIDRVYFAVKSPLRLVEGRRRVDIEAERFPDVVVWNPWQASGATMADLAPADFRRFVCVEAALIGRPLQLAPAEEWCGRQSLIAG
jgi:glucose-6-phosphate 1-epimerase